MESEEAIKILKNFTETGRINCSLSDFILAVNVTLDKLRVSEEVVYEVSLENMKLRRDIAILQVKLENSEEK